MGTQSQTPLVTKHNMPAKHKIPPHCPVCVGDLYPTEVTCSDCGTRIQSAFEPSRFCRLTAEQLQFVEIFLRSRGNLSGVGDELDISYPTVTRRLEAVLTAIAPPGTPVPTAQLPMPSHPSSSPPPAPSLALPPERSEEERARERREILEMLDRGDITADQATHRLQEL